MFQFAEFMNIHSHLENGWKRCSERGEKKKQRRSKTFYISEGEKKKFSIPLTADESLDLLKMFRSKFLTLLLLIRRSKIFPLKNILLNINQNRRVKNLIFLPIFCQKVFFFNEFKIA